MLLTESARRSPTLTRPLGSRRLGEYLAYVDLEEATAVIDLDAGRPAQPSILGPVEVGLAVTPLLEPSHAIRVAIPRGRLTGALSRPALGVTVKVRHIASRTRAGARARMGALEMSAAAIVVSIAVILGLLLVTDGQLTLSWMTGAPGVGLLSAIVVFCAAAILMPRFPGRLLWRSDPGPFLGPVDRDQRVEGALTLIRRQASGSTGPAVRLGIGYEGVRLSDPGRRNEGLFMRWADISAIEAIHGQEGGVQINLRNGRHAVVGVAVDHRFERAMGDLGARVVDMERIARMSTRQA